MAVVPRRLLDQVRDDVPQREGPAGALVTTHCLFVPVVGSNELVGVGRLLGVLVEKHGKRLLEPGAHLELGVVVGARPLVASADEDDVDPEGFGPAQVAD